MDHRGKAIPRRIALHALLEIPPERLIVVAHRDDKDQLQEDIMNDQISMKEYYDPFTGEKYFGGK